MTIESDLARSWPPNSKLSGTHMDLYPPWLITHEPCPMCICLEIIMVSMKTLGHYCRAVQGLLPGKLAFHIKRRYLSLLISLLLANINTKTTNNIFYFVKIFPSHWVEIGE